MPLSNRVLLSSLRNHLVSLGLVRLASSGAPFVLPPMWIHPPEGTPAPGDPVPEGVTNDAKLVTSIRVGGDIPQAPGEQMFWETTVDVRYRTARDQQVLAMDLDAQLQARLVGSPEHGTDYGMTDWWMPSAVANPRVHVARSYLYGAALAPLGYNHTGGEDFITKFGFLLHRD